VNTAVVGLGFGDEGKGVVTDYLCSLSPRSAVLRFSGGHQAAHTVFYNGTNHVFSNFGSGTLRGCETYWSEFCTFEPRGFCNELNILRKKGISPILHIHNNCMVTTPYDIIANWLSSERAHGTTGVGIWKTIERNNNNFHLSATQILTQNEKTTKAHIKEVANYYSNLQHENLSDMLEEFYDAVKQIQNDDSIQLFYNYPHANSMVFEGSQGLLLDKDIGFWPYVTPSKTNMENVFKLGYSPSDVFLVTRAYQTRHGTGPMTNEDKPFLTRQVEAATQDNVFQGKLRKTMLDLDLLEKGVRLGIDPACGQRGIKKNLVITCLDQIDEYTLTHNETVLSFDGVGEFISYIGETLGITGELYGNYSPYSDTVSKVLEVIGCQT